MAEVETMDFEEKYKPQENHLDPTQHILYETYGKELEYIREMARTNRVWTLVEGDDNHLYWIAGMHYVNRLNYCVTEIPWVTGEENYLDV